MAIRGYIDHTHLQAYTMEEGSLDAAAEHADERHPDSLTRQMGRHQVQKMPMGTVARH
jgi:hypothetical protein